jgi:hypothetical protein
VSKLGFATFLIYFIIDVPEWVMSEGHMRESLIAVEVLERGYGI